MLKENPNPSPDYVENYMAGDMLRPGKTDMETAAGGQIGTVYIVGPDRINRRYTNPLPIGTFPTPSYRAPPR